MCDHHDVQALDRLEVVGRHGVGHHPGVDQHVIAACSADLPGAMTDPCELDLIVDRHLPPPWTRGLVRGRDKTARPRVEPVLGTCLDARIRPESPTAGYSFHSPSRKNSMN